MNFLLSNTFTTSLAKLTGEEQKAVKTTAFDLQVNPASPSLSFHKLDRARDKNFWSVRVNLDLRIIVHRTEASLLLCYVDHHDKAYEWAERRKLETHPVTGAAQLVEIRECVQEVPVIRYIEQAAIAKPALFAGYSDDELLQYGVPQEWLADVRTADEDFLLALADHLPAEAAEALLELATGGTPQVLVAEKGVLPFDHPDALRRFRVLDNQEELAQALEFPWDKWSVFLHPAQRDWVERDFNGPARVSGSAGTGKTVVALHRAVHLARQHPDSRVLLVTFSEALANNLRIKLRCLVAHQPTLAERIDVYALDALADRLYRQQLGPVNRVSDAQLGQLLQQAADDLALTGFNPRFLLTEWCDVVDAWQLKTWEDYRDVRRLGRKTRLPENRRAQLWAIFERVMLKLAEQRLVTQASMFAALTEHLSQRKNPLFDFVVIDEAQDVSVAQLRFLAALGAQRANGLFFAGDLGQRIFQQPFSWSSLGVEVRGRVHTLKINYRTSHQIRQQADKLLGPEVSDVDGNCEDRRHTISVFNGPAPEIKLCDSVDDEIILVAGWLQSLVKKGVALHEIGVFVRSAVELSRARQALQQAGLAFDILDEHTDVASENISLCTMHLAKGLEFRAVAVMACDDDIIPLQSRLETAAEMADLEEAYNTERQLLYVACTRARDYLLIASGGRASEFLDDFK
ncbi:UvrD-helicase domain-containing protein [Cellvibrio japonicus]|uniref:DNA 3'-5' helicase n=1 Tax=Cellvibrio japonicus (strain Ueda107) TaxID=498211 RepID=B3PHQ6_CELJU|nr:UvrD-helicase domain-containing protein [Cellvibrio japonicus]ACE86037.1 putative DNA helicase [Cellvibrio japonicus Ueda107]QEI13852.1 AAA family ATPase [Cellvibrio japonicus]QEI17426.1 AAA family ATPase [Cellvibrio japonicus]QEI21002.1 AAA family ATPase [Cellvibrio japonicus]